MLPLSLHSGLPEYGVLIFAAILVFVAVLGTKLGSKFGTPFLLIFLLLGIVAGEDILGFKFEDYSLAETLGHLAMTAILFSAGLETPWKTIKPVLKPALMLSTVGILIMVLLTGIFIYVFEDKFLGIENTSLITCLLVAAIMSSTDSASVFSILKGKRVRLRENLAPLLEVESSSNDPMAYIVTIVLVEMLMFMSHAGSGGSSYIWFAIFTFLRQVIVGVGVGLGLGYASKYILNKVNLSGSSLYSIMILSIALFAGSISGMLGGNSLLSLIIVAVIIGSGTSFRKKESVLQFFKGISWLMQLVMFLILGLLARPSQMLPVFIPTLLIGLFIIFVARPASVFLSLLPFKSLSFRAKLLVSWVGLKGAGPILFALTPVVAGMEGSAHIFNIVFSVTLLSLLLQGMSLFKVAYKLNLSYEEDPKVVTFGMAIPEEMGMLRDHIVSEEDLAMGETLRDLGLPHGIRVMTVKRDGKFFVPHGSMRLYPGDHLVIMMGESDD